MPRCSRQKGRLKTGSSGWRWERHTCHSAQLLQRDTGRVCVLHSSWLSIDADRAHDAFQAPYVLLPDIASSEITDPLIGESAGNCHPQQVFGIQLSDNRYVHCFHVEGQAMNTQKKQPMLYRMGCFFLCIYCVKITANAYCIVPLRWKLQHRCMV